MLEFWIDVGGTFTDCLFRESSGKLRRHKVLSSGVTKGAVGVGSTPKCVVDPARQGDPPAFWNGYTIRLLDTAGRSLATTKVVSFDCNSGTLEIDQPIAVHAGQLYELVGDEEAPILAIRWLWGLRRDQPIPPCIVRLGTTRGTNTLLTRRGARTAFITTRGFADVLRIGYQNRPRLFARTIRKPEPLFTDVVEIDERVTVEGIVLRAPDPGAVRASLVELRSAGVESLAICLMHAYRFGAHEQLVEQIAREVGFTEISTSSHIAPLVKIVARGETTVVDAYLNPVLRTYIASLRASLPAAQVRLMTSAGGLVAANQFSGKDSILSGPAGGVVGFAGVARAAGFERAIGFDMGGTSTDVARFDGRYEFEYESEKAGVRLSVPMMAIETVAAGGGSICRFDGVKLVVGPDSAGAEPGPACYGRGGPLCVTDLNYYLGRILSDSFPLPLDCAAVERRLQALIEEIAAGTGRRFAPHELCEGFLQVANANMVKAVERISLSKGANPRDYVLVAFGGAAPQHACAVAKELGITQVLNHPDAGILSAYGIGHAEVTRHRALAVYQPLTQDLVERLEPAVRALIEDARGELVVEGIDAKRVVVHRSLELRYRGLDASLTIAEPSDGDWTQAYELEHEKLYGYRHEGRGVELVAVRAAVVGAIAESETVDRLVPMARGTPSAIATTVVWFDGREHHVPVFERADLRPNDAIKGPAILREALSTTIIDPG
ncbi:MAG TPA: hydantoinase/oxoprolinase family protein, partial [Pirellulales bacterium]|nr:hydantoinase/oxoprolinase family protein [Pirellulales bacterium]